MKSQILDLKRRENGLDIESIDTYMQSNKVKYDDLKTLIERHVKKEQIDEELNFNMNGAKKKLCNDLKHDIKRQEKWIANSKKLLGEIDNF